MIDIHCHLTYPGLIEIKEKVIEEAKSEMKAIITCGYPKDCLEALELSKKYSGFVYLTLGLHPIDIIKMSDEEVNKYLDFIREHADDILAVGEIGLDKHWFKDKKENERFEKVFIQCLELSKELDLPAILHLRKTEEDGFKIVLENKIEKAVFHCYGGNITLGKQIIEKNYFISLATNINNSKNSKDIARKFPLKQLLTETDSPFLSPVAGKPNVPQNVKMVIEKIAEERQMSFDEVDRITTENAINLFRINLF